MEVKTIACFIVRMGMYIPEVDKNNIISFLTGYEIDKEFFFSRKIEEYLKERGIETNSFGSVEQIQKFAETHSLDWVTAFIQIGFEIIVEEDKNILKEIKIDNRVRGIIHRIQFPIEESWIQEWLSFCTSKENWFYQLWTEKESIIITVINTKIEEYRNHKIDKVELSNELIKLKVLFENINSPNISV